MKSLKCFELDGLSFITEEVWNKLRSNQFGGNPGRGAGELIQNAWDSYDASIPFQDRKIIIRTQLYEFSIFDYGSGFSLEKLRLLLTFGGTDKLNDQSKIGQFGIGFISIFSKPLFTRQVIITTVIDGTPVSISFSVVHPDKLPVLNYFVLKEKPDFSTCITVRFSNGESVRKCLLFAKKAAENFPCKIDIDGNFFETIWEQARNRNYPIFKNDTCYGFFKPGGQINVITVYCKFEYIIRLRLVSLLKGQNQPEYNLSDYKEFPYIPCIDTVINCNSLNLTISRDSYYLDYYHYQMIGFVKEQLFTRLAEMDFEKEEQIVLANLYTLRNEMGQYIKTGSIYPACSSVHMEVIKKLANAKVFRLSNDKRVYSTAELKNMISAGTPLFYSSDLSNLDYLGGNFKHDFIVLPQQVRLLDGAPELYQSLFESIFGDIVDLGTIQGNNELINKLIDRGIISREDLVHQVGFVGEQRMNPGELQFMQELTVLVNNEAVLGAVEKNLFLEINRIKPMFFEIREEGAYISTGFFDELQQPVTDDYFTNFIKKDESDSGNGKRSDLILGLRKDHPLMEKLIESNDKHRTYYALTFIAHELTACQKLLVPYSRFWHLKKENLGRDIREALITNLIMDVA